jgi:GTPase SAR1 family protein
VILSVWTSSGNPIFAPLGFNFYGNTDLVYLMYDLTNPESLESLQKWRKLFFEQKGVNPFTKIWIIGNKTDVYTLDKVSVESVKKRFPLNPHVQISVRSGKEKLQVLLQESINTFPCPRKQYGELQKFG